MIEAPITVALNASTYVAVKIGKTVKPGKPLAIYTDDASKFWIATVVAGTGAVPVLANNILSYERVVADDSDGGIALWAKAETGTPNLIVIPGAGQHTNV